VAIYFLNLTTFGRSGGSSAVSAAAYRAGERIRDERSGKTYDHSDRQDVMHKEIILPDQFVADDMGWAKDRANLWNTAEAAETRKNARVAREYLVALPAELPQEHRLSLVRGFSRELVERYRFAVDVTIHAPRDFPGSDPRNFHAHLLMTTREVSPDGIGSRTTLELVGRERHLRGLGPSRDEYLSIRERWANLTNDALREAGLTARVDHRSLKHQGIDREPVPTIPEKVFYAERQQGPSAAGDAIRARHRERVEARLKGGDELARVLEKQKRELKERALDDFKRRDAQPKQIRWSSLTRAERNELRRTQYEARRAIERQDPVGEARRREQARQWYHAARNRNPEAVRERQRQWRRSNADEVNRKQREYRKANADELNRKRREYWRDHTDEANRKQRDYRRAARVQDNPSSSPTSLAMESAKKWLEYRETHGPGPTAEESARNWLAYREKQQLPEPAQSASVPAREQQREPARAEDHDIKSRPNPDYDHEL